MPKKKATKKKKVLLESEKLEGWNDTKDKFTLNLIRSGNYDLKRTEHRYLQTICDQFDLFENTPRTIFYKHWRELKKKRRCARFEELWKRTRYRANNIFS